MVPRRDLWRNPRASAVWSRSAHGCMGCIGFAEQLEGRFLAWNRTTEPGRGFIRYKDLIDIMEAAVYFEANRPFDRDWYGVLQTQGEGGEGAMTSPRPRLRTARL